MKRSKTGKTKTVTGQKGPGSVHSAGEAVEVLPPESEELQVDVLPPGLEVIEALPESSAAPAASREIVPYDALSAFLREISQYPRLSREEEHALAVDYHKNQSIESAYKLVSSNLYLVVKIARDYERAARSLLDLIGEGNIGLMEAVKNFDPYREVRFPSYAVWWIKAYIIRYVIANWRLVKIGTTQAQRKLFFNLYREKEKLEREGIYPGPKLLAQKLDVKESEVVEMEQRLGSQDLSVDHPAQPGTEGDLLSVLPSDQASAEDLLLQKETRRLLLGGLEDFAATLNPKELLIFKGRMLSEDKPTLQELAEKLSISAERVRQLENKLRDKLKAFMLERVGDLSETADPFVDRH